MKFGTNIKCKIINRYKRFLADVILEEKHLENRIGQVLTVHTANTGSMKTCWEKGWDAIISYHDSPTRKLKYSLEMTHNTKSWIGVNTILANKITLEALKNKELAPFKDLNEIKPEFKIEKSRIDFKIFNLNELNEEVDQCFIEVKNVSMINDQNIALFPDAVSTRGQKHLEELIKLKKQGHRACMLYIIQREDSNAFSPADDIDPEYGKILRNAIKEGVEAYAYSCYVSPEEIRINKAVKIIL